MGKKQQWKFFSYSDQKQPDVASMKLKLKNNKITQT